MLYLPFFEMCELIYLRLIAVKTANSQLITLVQIYLTKKTRNEHIIQKATLIFLVNMSTNAFKLAPPPGFNIFLDRHNIHLFEQEDLKRMHDFVNHKI